jgi:sugar phosphate isomerase/epimerase
LFEKIVRLSGAGVTFDVGHAFACESVESQHFSPKDFITPHASRVFNAHIYQIEHPELGHMPPDRYEDIMDQLALVARVPCNWWVIELREPDGLLRTKQFVEQFFYKYSKETPGASKQDNLSPQNILTR